MEGEKQGEGGSVEVARAQHCTGVSALAARPIERLKHGLDRSLRP